MATETTTWESLGKFKLSSINNSIPSKWRISSIPSIEAQRDVTGPFIQNFLSKEEVDITETDAAGIVEKTSTGKWTAEEVATAFCHRASLAHQLTNCLHEIFLMLPSKMLRSSTSTTRSTRHQLDPCMDCPLVSRTNSMLRSGNHYGLYRLVSYFF